MRAQFSVRLGHLLILGAIVGPARAQADDDEATVPNVATVQYEAPDSCPRREWFLAAMMEHFPEPSRRGLIASTSDLSIGVQIQIRDGWHHGVMQRRDPSGASAPRTLSAFDCAEVAGVLALTAALSLTSYPSARTPPSTRQTMVGDPAMTGAIHRQPNEPFLAVGIRGGQWLSGTPMTGPELSGGVARRWGWNGRPFWWTGRLRAAYVRNDGVDGDARGRFAILTADLEICPVGTAIVGRWEAGLCAAAEVGWLQGRGLDVAKPSVADALAVSLGGGPLVLFSLSPRWQIESRVAFARSIREVHFIFDAPRQTVASTSPVNWTAALGLVLRFR